MGGMGMMSHDDENRGMTGYGGMMGRRARVR